MREEQPCFVVVATEFDISSVFLGGVPAKNTPDAVLRFQTLLLEPSALDEADGEKSASVKTCRSTGHNPLDQNPLMAIYIVAAFENAIPVRNATSSAVSRFPGFSLSFVPIADPMYAFSGLKDTSKGCIQCVQWDGSNNMNILGFWATSMVVRLWVWVLCPSRINKTFASAEDFTTAPSVQSNDRIFLHSSTHPLS
uniref:Uncharacterized protein n=1 Tax=Timema poppense TaxID=170557 RepID=A0A7R9DNQ1_TIMPO|nr:unnamed protein product [Timema poppensis]